jgi:hypothetical protein
VSTATTAVDLPADLIIDGVAVLAQGGETSSAMIRDGQAAAPERGAIESQEVWIRLT